MTVRTRFAPSPTGPLHLGHAYAAIIAHDLAHDLDHATDGTFLLRIEDIDRARARPEWEALIYEDLHWLGLGWPTPVMRQSDRGDAYDAALDRLWDCGLLYCCTCTRRDIRDAMAAPQEGSPTFGPDGPIYPGTCRPHSPPTGPRPRVANLRLDMERALQRVTQPLIFTETGAGPIGQTGQITLPPDHFIDQIGDVVLARRDMGTSYHLSVVVDDAAQAITHVTRGADLFDATGIHTLIQDLLALPRPLYRHHRLIRDDNGKRLAKRDDARALKLYRDQGCTAEDIRAMLDL